MSSQRLPLDVLWEVTSGSSELWDPVLRDALRC